MLGTGLKCYVDHASTWSLCSVICHVYQLTMQLSPDSVGTAHQQMSYHALAAKLPDQSICFHDPIRTLRYIPRQLLMFNNARVCPTHQGRCHIACCVSVCCSNVPKPFIHIPGPVHSAVHHGTGADATVRPGKDDNATNHAADAKTTVSSTPVRRSNRLKDKQSGYDS